MSFALPDAIKFNIDKMMKSLNLKFGGIDLALCNDNYYFIEVNPTGEWGWLETVAGLNISDAICDAMMR
jgi:glutathione synthase/RimK-type ligase-like ATP-grasp enzyme